MEKLFFNYSKQVEAVGGFKLLIFDKGLLLASSLRLASFSSFPFLFYFQIDAVGT
jgi:hypothetical protein